MARSKRMLPIETIRELLDYDENTGRFTWRFRPLSMFQSERTHKTWNTRFAGKPALCTLAHNGYLYGAIFGENFSAHRVAWHYVNGVVPNEIDHINGDKTDNRIANLRSVNRRTNCQNLPRRSGNSSGSIGVSWDKVNSKWHVRLGTKHIGRFASFDDAVKARKDAEREYGYHENHGRELQLQKEA
jgi:hypothetical protein